MALEDLIAEAGPQMFESMRKGWLPNQEERQARSLKDLQLQTARQKVEYEPERQRIARKKAGAEFDYRAAATESVIQQSKRAKTKDEWDLTKRNLDITTNFIRGASNVFKKTKNIGDAKELIRQNYKAVIDAGDDGTDQMVDRFISSVITDEEAEKTLRNLNAVLPDVLKQADKEDLAWKKKAGTSSFERSLLANLEAGTITQEEYDYRMDQYNQKQAGIQQDFVKIENSEGGYDVWDRANNQKVGAIPGVKSGAQARHETDLTFKQKQARTKGTTNLRKEASTELDSYSSIDKNITKALHAQMAGDKGLSDKYVTLLMTQVEATNFRAFKMYEVFDGSYGNAFERVKDYVHRIAWGDRTDEQNNIIRSFLENMQKFNKPILQKVRSKYRSMATEMKYDVGLVVPFETLEDLKKFPGWKNKQKLEYLKKNKHLIKKKGK